MIRKDGLLMVKVLFVCLGNICRSPMAEAIFRDLVEKDQLSGKISIDSAGTSGWHTGNPPHKGTLEILKKYKISEQGLKARQFTADDLHTFDYIVVMDDKNLDDVKRIGEGPAKVLRLLDIVDASELKNVPDPYYTGDFEETYDLVTKGCDALLQLIKEEHQL